MVKKIRADKSLSTLLKEAFPYRVGYGKSSIATCRSCFHKFHHNELRIQTSLIRKFPSSFLACEINLCMKLSCIVNPSKKFSTKYQSWVRYERKKLTK